MTQSLALGSIGALAQANGKSIAETFLSCDVIVIVDTSGSMGSKDALGGKSRYDAACEQLGYIQANMPGKIAVIAFSSSVEFSPSGIPPYLCGGTDLARALQFTKIADVPDMRFILISDGDPDDRDAAFKIAQTYQNHIDVIYVGPESHPAGRDFLQKLAAATGGQAVTADRAAQLGSSITLLLQGRK